MAQTDRDVLCALFRSTSGANWTKKDKWDTDAYLSQWHGVKTNDQGRVVELRLNYNNLQGHIPEELGALSELQWLALSGNKLTGPIPGALGALSELQELRLNNNQLTEAIPKELGALSKLESLRLGRNELRGSIPASLGQLGNLSWLFLDGNKLKGPIPEALGALSELFLLHLNNNQLKGPIPKELGDLATLQELHLDRNQLTGSIPEELGALPKLERFYLSRNELTGSIPPSLGYMGALIKLDLGRNQLSGLGEAEDALRLVERVGGGLRLENNPWIMPPEAVVEAGLPAVKRYLLDVQEAKKAGADVTSLQLLKVVLVGSASAGKTSLMQSIVAGCGSPTKGTPAQASTVGIELLRHKLQDTTVEFFDCAGQVDYAGMHQTFLTRRALYLLVVDITRYRDLDDLESLDKEIHEDIMRWLYNLNLRAPDSTVILVANKCDGSIDGFAQTAARVEAHAREVLKQWHAKRGSDSQDDASMTGVTLLEGVSRVSCLADGSSRKSGLKALIDRVANQASTFIVVPPAWDLALKVFDALRDGREPKRFARNHLQLNGSAAAVDGDGVAGVRFLTKEELSDLWNDVVESIRGDLQAIGRTVAVSNKDSAFEGALWISNFAGHTLGINGGKGIFLDVVWLSKVLKPILSHKLRHETFVDDLSAMRDDLVYDGVLRWQFARHLWRDFIGHTVLQSKEMVVVMALFDVLTSLGVAFPLPRATLSINANFLTSAARGDSSDPSDMLVIMRLERTHNAHQRRQFDHLGAGMLQGDQEVALKWRFDFAGPPRGLVEQLIASCHVLGEVERSSCWKYGAVFKSGTMTSKAGRTARLYTLALSYDGQNKVLTAKLFGPLENERVWRAIRYMASSMVNISKEWPGAFWEGWPECSKHHPRRLYLASSSKARVGDLLLPAAAAKARRDGCDCLLESGGVLSLILEKLGVVIDTGKDPFEGLPVEWDDPAEEDTEDLMACNCVREAFFRWQPHAQGTAKWLWGLAVTLFTGAVVVGIVENIGALWKNSLAIVCLLVVLAAVASFFACSPTNCGVRVDQRQSGGQQENPADVVATFA